MHFQENTVFDLHSIAQYPIQHVIYAAAKFEVGEGLDGKGGGLVFTIH